MRKPLLIAAGAVTLLIGGIGIALLLVDPNQFRPMIQARLEQQFHQRTVKLGNLSLSWLPLAVRVGPSVIGDRNAAAPPFVEVQEIDVRAELVPLLLRREIRVNSFVLRRPLIRLEKDRAGVWNYADLLQREESGGTQSLTLDELRIEDGAFAIATPASRSTVEHVNVDVRDLTPGKPVTFQASLQLPGASAADSLSAKGTVHPGSDFTIDLALKDAPAAGLAALAGVAPIPVLGTLNGSAALNSKGDALSAKGRVELSKAEYEKRPLPSPVALDFLMNGSGSKLRADTLRLTAGQVNLNGSGTVDTAASTMDLQLRLGETPLADLLALAGAVTDVPVKATEGRVSLQAALRGPISRAAQWSGTGTLRDAKITTAALSQPLTIRTASLRFDPDTTSVTNLDASLAGSNAKGTLTLRGSSDLTFDLDVDQLDTTKLENVLAADSGKKQPARSSGPPLRAKGRLRAGSLIAQGLRFTQLQSDCVWERDVLTLDPLRAQLFGGTHSGRIVLDTRQQPAALETALKLENVDANQLLSATTSIRQLIYGMLAASGDAKLRLAADPAGIARSVNGNVRMELNKGRIAGVNILNQLSGVAKVAGFAVGQQNLTDIVQMNGDIGIVNGMATTKNLRLQIPGANLAVEGGINLADEALNLKLLAVLDKQLSQRAGGGGVLGVLQTVLANQNGELVIPALVTGTLAQPRFLPDAARMAELKLQQSGGPVKGIVDLFRRKK